MNFFQKVKNAVRGDKWDQLAQLQKEVEAMEITLEKKKTEITKLTTEICDDKCGVVKETHQLHLIWICR